jgi:hypothetical protein
LRSAACASDFAGERAPAIRIEAHRSRSREYEIQEAEAEQDGCIATVKSWEEALRRMGQEICKSHQTGEHESDWAGEKTYNEQRTTKEFQSACGPGQRECRRVHIACWEAEDLLRTVREEGKSERHTHQAQCYGGKAVERLIEMHGEILVDCGALLLPAALQYGIAMEQVLIGMNA